MFPHRTPRLESPRRADLFARADDPAAVEDEGDFRRPGSRDESCGQAVLRRRDVLHVARGAGPGRENIGEVVDRRIAGERRHAGRHGADTACREHVELPQRPVEGVIRAALIVRPAPERKAPVGHESRASSRCERRNIERPTDRARTVERRARAAQQFDALDFVAGIGLSVDLPAEAVLRRDAVDENRTAIVSRTRERRAKLTVICESTVAAVRSNPGRARSSRSTEVVCASAIVDRSMTEVASGTSCKLLSVPVATVTEPTMGSTRTSRTSRASSPFRRTSTRSDSKPALRICAATAAKRAAGAAGPARSVCSGSSEPRSSTKSTAAPAMGRPPSSRISSGAKGLGASAGGEAASAIAASTAKKHTNINGDVERAMLR